MNEAVMFSWWLSQSEKSTLTQDDIRCLTVVDITTKLNQDDLLAVLYYGKGTAALTALNALKEKFEAEMHRLESLTYPQERETCE